MLWLPQLRTACCCDDLFAFTSQYRNWPVLWELVVCKTPAASRRRLFSLVPHQTRNSTACASPSTMVYYPLPKFIKKSQLRDVRPYKWSADDKRENIEALIATCSRCVQAIASQKKKCRKPSSQRCDHCAEGNRGGCDLVSICPLRMRPG